MIEYNFKTNQIYSIGSHPSTMLGDVVVSFVCGVSNVKRMICWVKTHFQKLLGNC